MTESDKALYEEIVSTLKKLPFESGPGNGIRMHYQGPWYEIVRDFWINRGESPSTTPYFRLHLWQKGSTKYGMEFPWDAPETPPWVWPIIKDWYEIVKDELKEVGEAEMKRRERQDEEFLRKVLNLSETVPVENLNVRYAYNLWKEQQNALQK